MKGFEKFELDFIVDKLTNSIQNTISGDSFQTEISRFTIKDSRQTTKKNGWNFDWKAELNNNLNEVYKLTIVNNSDIIQGLLSVRKEADHIYMNLLENAPFNIGNNKLYEGVAGNLVAYACRLSFQYGFEGFVAFTAKTRLIEHYEKTLGAHHFGGHRMIIPTDSSKVLVQKYFKT
ncbi:hypothetical protein [Riemerella anatipestifer]|uniref:N-acetyltransferase n=1 Tax=Riemerella anatipestifer TaxID=34085 RepID=A0A0H4JFJ1_RIEAN|nr:hypothetical protein [Riemerella anatipestifer]AKO71467.1 hypothetical protein [Riemerella anatipestifer]AQY21064.1 hypothetical protein AB406_0099 [Riemerella anatipestifer]AQY23279.1 hypothetical protein AB406_2350 [Riemerella anatipestifer]MBO4234779.1 hypothetical protein [Riemerella anatipestifer]MCO4304929.1 hypothetical protein [Riemerella anatipestifer]